MNINDMTAGQYITKNDVDPPKIVTIKSLKRANLAKEDQEPRLKWTIRFEELEKPMVANKTNLKRIAKILGPESDEWIGQKICLYFDDEVEFGGEQVGGIRVRPAKKQVVEDDAMDQQALAQDRARTAVKKQAIEDDIPF